MLTASFDGWWKQHRHLFVLEQVKIITGIEETDGYVYLKIPTNRNERELFTEIKDLLTGKTTGDVASYPFSNSGIPYLSLHIQYNCLVMNMNGKTGDNIIDWLNDKYEKPPYGDPQSVSRTLVKGRKRLEDVCNLVFP